jgi:hypothetical protein
MRAVFTKFQISILALLFVGAAAGQDVQTSFEFFDTSGSFTLGTPPRTVTFTGGQAKTVGIESLYRSGLNAWMIDAGDTGEITFETPAADLKLYFRDQTSSVQSILTVFGPGDSELATFDGSTASFQEVEFQDSQITRITLQNRGATGYTVIDDFSFTAFAESDLEIVDRFFFPFFASGIAGDIQFLTNLFFANVASDAFLNLEFRDRAGAPLVVELPGLGMSSELEAVALPRGSTLALEPPGDGPIQIGYVIVTVLKESSSGAAQTSENGAGVGATAVFTRLEADSGLLVTEAGVPASRAIEDFSLFLDSRGTRDTGLAIVNPAPDGSVTAQDQVYTVTVWDVDFSTVIAGPIEVALAPGEALGQFIWEIFQDAGAAAGVVETLRETFGLVTVQGTGVAVTLRQDDSGEPFPIQVPTFTTFPVIPGAPETENGSAQ